MSNDKGEEKGAKKGKSRKFVKSVIGNAKKTAKKMSRKVINKVTGKTDILVSIREIRSLIKSNKMENMKSKGNLFTSNDLKAFNNEQTLENILDLIKLTDKLPATIVLRVARTLFVSLIDKNQLSILRDKKKSFVVYCVAVFLSYDDIDFRGSTIKVKRDEKGFEKQKAKILKTFKKYSGFEGKLNTISKKASEYLKTKPEIVNHKHEKKLYKQTKKVRKSEINKIEDYGMPKKVVASFKRFIENEPIKRFYELDSSENKYKLNAKELIKELTEYVYYEEFTKAFDEIVGLTFPNIYGLINLVEFPKEFMEKLWLPFCESLKELNNRLNQEAADKSKFSKNLSGWNFTTLSSAYDGVVSLAFGCNTKELYNTLNYIGTVMNAGSDCDLRDYTEKQKCVEEEVGKENLKIINDKLNKFLELVKNEEEEKCKDNPSVESFILILQKLRENFSETDDNANQENLKTFINQLNLATQSSNALPKTCDYIKKFISSDSENRYKFGCKDAKSFHDGVIDEVGLNNLKKLHYIVQKIEKVEQSQKSPSQEKSGPLESPKPEGQPKPEPQQQQGPMSSETKKPTLDEDVETILNIFTPFLKGESKLLVVKSILELKHNGLKDRYKENHPLLTALQKMETALDECTPITFTDKERGELPQNFIDRVTYICQYVNTNKQTLTETKYDHKRIQKQWSNIIAFVRKLNEVYGQISDTSNLKIFASKLGCQGWFVNNLATQCTYYNGQFNLTHTISNILENFISFKKHLLAPPNVDLIRSLISIYVPGAVFTQGYIGTDENGQPVERDTLIEINNILTQK